MKRYILLLSCFCLTACQNREHSSVDAVKFPPPVVNADEQYQAQEIMVTPAPPKAQPVANNAIAVDKKVIKEGEISIETNDLKAARKSLTDTLAKIGGYIDEESESNNAEEQRKLYVFKVRIPVQSFERFLNTVSAAADRVESKNIRIKDVTTEYIDITTRLNNKKLLENRYKELLAKAGKVSDILEVENKLNDIRTDIEASQGQLNYLNKQIAYSLLEITFFTKNSLGNNDGNGFSYKLRKAFGDSWEVLQSVFFGIITFWPVIALLIIIYLLFKAWRKRKSRTTAL